MREYILTDRERAAVQKFLKTKVADDFIHVLRHRAKEALPGLREDLKLLEAVINEQI